MKLADAISSISVGGISIVSKVSWLSISVSISTTLATNNMLEGMSRRVKLADAIGSISVRGISIVSKVSWLSISATLSKSLRRPGNKRGSSTGMSSDTGNKGTETIAISIRTETIAIGKVSWLSLGISTTLANITTAPKTGGL